MANFSRSDFGGYFVDKQGDVWQVIGYLAEPSITIQRVKDSKTEDFGINGQTAATFTRLVKDHQDGFTDTSGTSEPAPP